MTALDLVMQYIGETGYIKVPKNMTYKKMLEQYGLIEAIRPFYELDWSVDEITYNFLIPRGHILKCWTELGMSSSAIKRKKVQKLKKCAKGLLFMKYKRTNKVRNIDIADHFGLNPSFVSSSIRRVTHIFTQEQIDSLLEQIDDLSI